jgi:hypothetical protein
MMQDHHCEWGWYMQQFRKGFLAQHNSCGYGDNNSSWRSLGGVNGNQQQLLAFWLITCPLLAVKLFSFTSILFQFYLGDYGISGPKFALAELAALLATLPVALYSCKLTKGYHSHRMTHASLLAYLQMA